MLIYGAPGTGKTHLGLTVALTRYTLYCDTDRGLKTFNKVSKMYPEVADNIVMLEIMDTFSDLNELYQMLLKHNTVKQWNAFFKKKGFNIEVKKPFEAIVVDTMTELQRIFVEQLQVDDVLAKMKDPLNISPLRIQDWGSIKDLTVATSKAFRDLPIDFVCLCHEEVKTIEETKQTMGRPLLQGSSANDFGKYFDIEGRMVVRQGKHVIVTAPHGVFEAKSRIGTPAKLVDVTYPQLVGETNISNTPRKGNK